MPRHVENTAYSLTRAGGLDPNTTLLRQRTTAAISGMPRGATFIVIREGAGLSHYVTVPGDGVSFATILEVAKSVAARADAAGAPNLGQTRAIAHLVHERGSIAGSNAAINADISAVVDVASTSLRDGEWIAVSIRRPKRSEVRRNKAWLEHRGTHTHHSLEIGATVMSMWAGGSDTRAAKDLLLRVTGALPGFDLRTQARVLRPAGDVLAWVAIALAAAMGALIEPWAWAVAAVAVAGAAGTMAGVLPSRARRIRRLLSSGLAPTPATRLLPPTPPKRASVDRDGVSIPARDGDYPLHPAAFLVAPILPITLVAPHAGADSGSQTTKARTAPPILRESIGPVVGINDDEPVYLSAADQWAGVIALGEPGSGKSALVQAIWGYDCLVKAGHIDSRGGAGRDHTMIAFDTKGDGATADEYGRWASAAGGSVLRFDVSDQESTIGIELFPDTADVTTRARRVVNALRYVFGEGSIGPESFTTLQRIFIAAFATTPDVASQVPGMDTDRSAFYYANVLLGSRGEDLGAQLAGAIRSKAERTGDASAVAANEQLSPLYGPGVTSAARRALTKAPQNKIEQLLAAEHWWSRPRRATWQSLLNKSSTVVINLGSANGYLADDELAGQLAAMMMYTLADEMKRTCIGWWEKNRFVSVYADELKHLAGSNGSVVSWLRNDARSFGARAIFATQFPQQLDPEVRSTVLGFGTLVCFTQRDQAVARTVVEALSVDGSEWGVADVANLQQYEAIVRTTVHQVGQPSFTVAVPDFRAMRGSEFLALSLGGDAAPLLSDGGQPVPVKDYGTITFASRPKDANA